jgi:hypothetical protein
MRPLLLVALFLFGGLAAAAGPEYRVGRTAAPKAALLDADEAAWRPAAAIAWGPARRKASSCASTPPIPTPGTP